MAPTKKETSVELCNRVTTQGNTIAIRMLEYLSAARNAIPGFQTLAAEFLELCQVIWSIEAGLTEAAKARNALPIEVGQELDKRIRQVHDEFIVLSQMVTKFVENESHKGGFGKRFRMMFADTGEFSIFYNVEKMRTTMARSRDSLKISSAMFRWTIGDARADSNFGIGYAGLIAALERLNPSKAASLPSLHPPPTTDLPLPPVPPTKITHQHSEPLLPPSHRLDRPSLNEIRTLPDEVRSYNSEGHRPMGNDGHYHPQDETGLTRGIVELHRNWRAPSVHSSGSGTHSTRDTMYQQHGRYHGEPVFDGPVSVESVRSRTLMDEKMQDLAVHERYLHDSHHSKIDSPITPGQRQLRQSNGSKPAQGKAALITAVEQRKHRLLAQLLEGGARADAPMEAAMLQIAAQNRDTESIALLLQYGADANGSDREGVTPLYAATRAQCYESAKVLLKHGANPNLSAGPDSESPLSLAASQNQVDFVQLYLANGGDPDLIMENGLTALGQSMNKVASPKLVEILLTSGDPNSKNSEGTTALFQAIQANRIDLMTVLLDHGANPNLPGPKHPLWPSTYKPKALQLLLTRGADHKKAPGVMELAASLKKLESVKILMDAGVSPNVRKDGVYTPLCSAIRDNSTDIVTYLLEHGADPNLKSAEYPAFKCITHKRLHLLPQVVAAGADLSKPKGIIETAVQFNDKDAILYLIDQGVNPNDRTPEGGHTALTTAIRENRGDLVDLLLSRGADPAIRGQDWPLCMAVKQPSILKKLLAATPNPRAFRGVVEMAVVANQLESIKLLLGAGVSVEDKNCGVFSPLTTAIREERKDIVGYLLDVANADPNAPGEHLPIVKALRRYSGDTEIIQMLLTRGADINKMHRGWNAILQAVENGDTKILKLLIEMGGTVDLQAIDETGKPVIDIVTERGWEEGLALLFPNATPAPKAKQ